MMDHISKDNVTSSPRMGGRVLRWHTWPTIGTQTVMDHTGNMLRIYWQIFGSVPSSVCAYILFHDLPEVKSGDPPHPTKKNSPVLREEYDRIEAETLAAMVGRVRARQILGGIVPIERTRIKACDLLEMAEFAMVEMALGNRFADGIVGNVRDAITSLDLTEDDRQSVADFMDTEMERFK